MKLNVSAAATFAAFVALTSIATAQEQSGAETGEDAAAPQETVAEATEDGRGEVYVAGEYGDWQKRCVRTDNDSDPCQLYQLIEGEAGGSVAEFTVFPLPEGQQGPIAGATIITPLETLLTEQLAIQVDSGEAKLYPFSFCAATGCIARIGLTEADVQAYRAGNVARLRIVPAAAPDQDVILEVSLAGFTAGLASFSE